MNRCNKCMTESSQCINCRENPIYSSVPTGSLFTPYLPTCPRGEVDCIHDPAYIKHHHPAWFKELYGELSAEEVMKDHRPECTAEGDDYCDNYDDEDK